MNLSVALFFLHNVLATLLLGGKFRGRQDPVFKDYGAGLILTGVAFAIWSAAVLMNPQNLETYVTVGAFFFILSMVVFFAAGLQNMNGSNRTTLLAIGSVVALFLFIIRTFVYPSQPAISPEGLFFFNAQPIVQIIYIFGLALTVIPATAALASKFANSTYARLVHYGFVIEVMGGIILLTSKDTSVLYIDGYIIGLVYLLLWTSLLFSKKAWVGAK